MTWETGTEREILTFDLHFQQDVLLEKIAGLGEGDLQKALVPSGTSLIGLVKHLTYVHHRWFVMCFANQMPDLRWPIQEWRVEDGETCASLVDAYRRETERARAIVAAADLDALNTGWVDPSTGTVEWKPGEHNLRWIVLHMIEEIARHNGHADILREQIDGKTGIV